MKQLLLILLLTTSIICFANNIYVAPVGDDNSAKGRLEYPFASLEKACELVAAGDTVFIRGGIYYSEQRINHETDGTAENPIVFMAFPGEEPFIDGTNINLPNNGALLFVARWHVYRLCSQRWAVSY